MFQQQLLVSVQPRPRDVLSVGVVEPQEGQDGLKQPQSCHKPERRLKMQTTHAVMITGLKTLPPLEVKILYNAYQTELVLVFNTLFKGWDFM